MSTSPDSSPSEVAARQAGSLRDLIREPLDECLADADTCLERVRAIHDAYRELDRGAIGAEGILELKFACLHWRRGLLSRLSHAPPSWLGRDHNTLAGIVGALGARLPSDLDNRLSRTLSSRDYDHLLALQGRRSNRSGAVDALAGPGETLKIRANRSSAWPFERWKRKAAFARYELSGDGVNFRGLHFRPGDVLLANVNIDGNGVYTTLSDPARFSSHAAVFAILEDEEGRYPAVIETYEKGVRAVPLNVFLDSGFCAYVEVYRHRSLDESRGRHVNHSALELIDSACGYNFDSTADDRRYVSCCSVGRLLHQDAGLAPASCKSRIQHPGIRANLSALGYEYFDFFAPVDYLLDGNFYCVGWVDNGQFESLLARELVEGRFRELFMTRRLNPDRFPFMARLNRWGIGHIRRRSPLGRVIARVEGFDHRTLPKGPDPLLAVITVAEAEIGRMVQRTRRWLERLEDMPTYFSLDELANRRDVHDHIESTVQLAWLE